ncbi:MAG: TVP38/TMEM64 family protein [Candidatus Kariarchaeaceae archaeon]|jgi:uncharacterized membrane protein YdjX (TVP38/TMEM64 family)
MDDLYLIEGLVNLLISQINLTDQSENERFRIGRKIGILAGNISLNLFVSAGFLIMAAYFTGRFSFPNVDEINQYSAFVFIFGGIIFQAFIPGFPQELLFIYSGLEYGFIIGGLINWSAMVIAAQVSYEVGRASITGGKKIHSTFNRFQNSKLIQTLRKKGNSGLFFTRLFPFAPNDGLSLIAGTIPLPRKKYFYISVITFLPYSFFYAYIGTMDLKVIDRSIIFRINVILIFLSSILLLILILVRYFKDQLH